MNLTDEQYKNFNKISQKYRNSRKNLLRSFKRKPCPICSKIYKGDNGLSVHRGKVNH